MSTPTWMLYTLAHTPAEVARRRAENRLLRETDLTDEQVAWALDDSWSNTREHYEWLATAPIVEIKDWIEDGMDAAV